jgi:hypothetical protein
MNYFAEAYQESVECVAAETAALMNAAASQPCVAESIARADQVRWGGIEDLRRLRAMQPHLPQLPDDTARTVYLRVREAERRWASPSLAGPAYGDGVAAYDDHIGIARGNDAVLLSADHATDPVRRATGRREAADHGTAGLAVVLAQDGLVDAMVPLGRQTGNANVTIDSPYKDRLRTELRDASAPRLGFVSLHGKVPGHVTGLLETTEIHAFLGLGRYKPTDTTLEAAERIRDAARQDLGLRIEVANTTPFLLFEPDPNWQPGMGIRDKAATIKYDPATGRPKLNQPEPKLAALGDGAISNTTTNVVNEFIQADPAYPRIPILQVEMSRSLRLTPHTQWNRDPKAMAAGVYLGYRLAGLVAEVCYGLQKPGKL